MKKTTCILSIILALSIGLNIFLWRCGGQRPSVAKTDTVEVVRWDTIHDGEPKIKEEKMIGQVSVPLPSCSSDGGDIKKEETCLISDNPTEQAEKPDSVVLDVVQRKYTDDSTYTAYVSGVRVEDYPRLDSIITRQRTLERIVTRTVYREKSGLSVKIRPAVTAGYDPFHRTWGVMAGGAVILDW